MGRVPCRATDQSVVDVTLTNQTGVLPFVPDLARNPVAWLLAVAALLWCVRKDYKGIKLQKSSDERI